MKHLKKLLRSMVILVLVVLSGGIYFLLSGPGPEESSVITNNDIFLYQAGTLEIGVAISPEFPRVGDNQLIVELRDLSGNAVSAAIDAYAEMPAMGTMPAMRAPIDMKEIAPGHYEGTMNLSMRGEWPLTVTITDPKYGEKRLQFDLATDREGLAIVTGATPKDNAEIGVDDVDVIRIDNRRRQMIGVETGEVIYRELVKSIRAVGEVKIDERLLSQVTLKFDGYIGDLKADYVGTRVKENQILFTVYSPELLAAQQEYLETLKHRQHRNNKDGLLRAARQRLALWDITPREIKALEQRGIPQDYVNIYAPRGGIVIERNITEGGAVRKGETLLTIADLSHVWIEAEVFEADFELVHVGMKAAFTLPYLPGRTYTGDVEYIYPFLEGDSRTGRIRLSLENPEGILKPDMYAEVALKVKLGRRLSIPEEAIIVAGDSRVVFIDLSGGRLKPVHIKTGHSAQGFVEVLDGLTVGDTVVTSGNFLIAAETRLKTGIEQW